jgi:hypothetical protein
VQNRLGEFYTRIRAFSRSDLISGVYPYLFLAETKVVKTLSTKTILIQQFRNAVYQSVLKRADGFFNLLDALTVAGHVNSPVALSEEAPFGR